MTAAALPPSSSPSSGPVGGLPGREKEGHGPKTPTDKNISKLATGIISNPPSTHERPMSLLHPNAPETSHPSVEPELSTIAEGASEAGLSSIEEESDAGDELPPMDQGSPKLTRGDRDPGALKESDL